MGPLLRVENLVTTFDAAPRAIRAVDDISFDLLPATTISLVGESGSGKTVTSLSLMRLLPTPPAHHAGRILLDGKDLLKCSEREMRAVRGGEIAMIFQEPMTSLNPVFSVGWQIVEAILLHRKMSRKEARHEAVDQLRLVGIPDPDKRMESFPHELSGGMRQRVMIAMALSCRPRLLIADEPTTALDVTIQAQILELLARLQDELRMSILLITHDLGIVAEVAREVLVMYAGQLVERCSVVDLFSAPRHPYAHGLLRSMPTRTPEDASPPGRGRKRRLHTIEGGPPNLHDLPFGCRFAPRCSLARDICRDQPPTLREVAPEHFSRCHFPELVGTLS